MNAKKRKKKKHKIKLKSSLYFLFCAALRSGVTFIFGFKQIRFLGLVRCIYFVMSFNYESSL